MTLVIWCPLSWLVFFQTTYSESDLDWFYEQRGREMRRAQDHVLNWGYASERRTSDWRKNHDTATHH